MKTKLPPLIPTDITINTQACADYVEMGCGDSGKVHGGDLKYNGGGMSGVF